MAKILFLASWYPSRVDFLNGDFVERHATAIALVHDVTVIFVSKDLQLSDKLYEYEYEEKGRLKVYKAYYREFRSRFSILRKVVSQWRYLKCFHRLFLKTLRQQGKPDLIHLYIPFKAGIYALYLKFFKKIKYVISEQHSYYMPASNKYEEQSVITKWLIKLIFRNAVTIHTVSQALGEI
ncbi:MAG: glycosyltransferase, partial [Ginsengibacter sp.]